MAKRETKRERMAKSEKVGAVISGLYEIRRHLERDFNPKQILADHSLYVAHEKITEAILALTGVVTFYQSSPDLTAYSLFGPASG